MTIDTEFDRLEQKQEELEDIARDAISALETVVEIGGRTGDLTGDALKFAAKRVAELKERLDKATDDTEGASPSSPDNKAG